MRSKVVLGFILTLTGGLLNYASHAQNGAGSVYSIFGIGELTKPNSPASLGMGYAGIGLSSPYSINTINPAANDLAGLYFNHVFDIGFYYASTTYESQGNTENGSYGGLSNFNFWFKYGDKWNGQIGLSSYSNVGYNIYLSNVNSFQNGDYNVAYQGSGGLNQAYFSNSYSPVRNFSLGLKLALTFGSITHTEDVSGSQTLKRYLVENHTSISNLDLEYSANYRLQRQKYFLNFGLIYKNPTHLKGNTTSTISEWDYAYGIDVEENYLLEDRESASGYTLPRKVGVGLSYNTNKMILAGDVEFNQWSEGQIEGYDNDLVDTWRYSFGLEFTPDRFGEQALGRVSYRLGGYFENSYLKINNVIPNTYGFTGGMSIPLKKGSAINMSYHRKFNGTTDADLILESTHEVTLNFSIRQRWFQRQKYD